MAHNINRKKYLCYWYPDPWFESNFKNPSEYLYVSLTNKHTNENSAVWYYISNNDEKIPLTDYEEKCKHFGDRPAQILNAEENEVIRKFLRLRNISVAMIGAQYGYPPILDFMDQLSQRSKTTTRKKTNYFSRGSAKSLKSWFWISSGQRLTYSDWKSKWDFVDRIRLQIQPKVSFKNEHYRILIDAWDDKLEHLRAKNKTLARTLDRGSWSTILLNGNDNMNIGNWQKRTEKSNNSEKLYHYICEHRCRNKKIDGQSNNYHSEHSPGFNKAVRENKTLYRVIFVVLFVHSVCCALCHGYFSYLRNRIGINENQAILTSKDLFRQLTKF